MGYVMAIATTPSALKTLTDYFNVGDGKRATKDWAAEVRALSVDEKNDLCTQIVAQTGGTFTPAVAK